MTPLLWPCREAHEHITVPRDFVYVYDLPSMFNEDTINLPTAWHPEQYDIDQVWQTLSKKEVACSRSFCFMRAGMIAAEG